MIRRKPLNGLWSWRKAAPEFISGITTARRGKGKKVINFNPSANRREIVNFLYIKNVRGWKKYNYSAAMGFNGDVAVVNNFFYLLFFKRKKNSLSTAYHLWYGRVLYKYALFYIVKSARANWIYFCFAAVCLSSDESLDIIRLRFASSETSPDVDRFP